MRGDSEVLIFLEVTKALDAGMKLYRSANGVYLTRGRGGVIKPVFFSRVERRCPKEVLWPLDAHKRQRVQWNDSGGRQWNTSSSYSHYPSARVEEQETNLGTQLLRSEQTHASASISTEVASTSVQKLDTSLAGNADDHVASVDASDSADASDADWRSQDQWNNSRWRQWDGDSCGQGQWNDAGWWQPDASLAGNADDHVASVDASVSADASDADWRGQDQWSNSRGRQWDGDSRGQDQWNDAGWWQWAGDSRGQDQWNDSWRRWHDSVNQRWDSDSHGQDQWIGGGHGFREKRNPRQCGGYRPDLVGTGNVQKNRHRAEQRIRAAHRQP